MPSPRQSRATTGARKWALAVGRHVPRGLRRRLWSIARFPRAIASYPRAFRITRSPRSFRQIRRLENPTTCWPPSDVLVPIRVRPLNGAAVYVRSRSADIWALNDAFAGKYHLPPTEIALSDCRIIWDLGANIGLTMAHFAFLSPKGRIIGVELDAANVRLARRNLAPWADRCTLVQAAAWTTDGELVGYRLDPGAEQGSRIAAVSTANPNATAHTVSLNRLLELSGGSTIDFVKMDIEGAEQQVLTRSTDWADAVRCIKVEIHQPYDLDLCIADLSRLGFSTSVDRRHGDAVVGLREGD